MENTIFDRWEQGSFFHWMSPESAGTTVHPWSRAGAFYASGRDALRALIDHGRSERGWKRLHVPCYYCQEVVASLASTGIQVLLYNDGPQDSVFNLASMAGCPGDVVLRVNFFGLRGRLATASTCQPGVEVIDDFSHDPWCHDAWQGDSDWAIASLRKTLPLPDGGVLWSPKGHGLPRQPSLTQAHKLVSLQKLSAMVLKAQYLRGQPVAKETYRRMAEFSEAEISQGEISGLPEWTADLLDCVPALTWRDRRRDNHRAFSNALAGLPGLRVLQPSDEARTCPFSAIVIARSRGLRDGIRAALISRNVYPTILWPLDEPAVPGIPADYIDLSHRMFSIQCDARYTPGDLIRVADLVRQSMLEREGCDREVLRDLSEAAGGTEAPKRWTI